MSYQAVIFDLDGTLLDTLEDLADAANQALAEMGLPRHPVADYRYFVGDGLMALVERILPAESRDAQNVDKLATIFRHHYSRNWDSKSRPFAGIDEMLRSLAEAGLKLAVLSNKPHDFTSLCVERLLGGHSFSLVLGERKGVPKKPDPAGALEVAEQLRVSAEQCLYLGDTNVDMETARRAGMVAVGVLWGFRTRAELVDSGAEYLLEKPADIFPLLTSNP